MASSDSTIPLKRCLKCGEEKPLTPQNFEHSGKYIRNKCQTCRYKEDQERVRNYPQYDYMTCTKCGTVYPATKEFFYASKRKRGGINRVCKLCYSKLYSVGARNALPHWGLPEGYRRCSRCRNAFPETPEFFHQRYKPKHHFVSICKNCASDKHRQWHMENTAYTVDRVRQWRKKNPERYKETGQRNAKNWATRNPEKRLSYVHTRRARITGAGGSYTRSDIELQYKSQKGKCWHCGKKFVAGDHGTKRGFHIDHLTPIDRGGTNYPNNIVLACPHCNMSKGARMPHEWNGRLF